MKRLRVLSVINTLHFGGDESRLLALAKGIDRERFDHTVLTLKQPNADLESKYGSLRPQFLEFGIRVADLNHRAVSSPHGSAARVARSVPRLLNTLSELVRFIRSKRIDVIDAHIGTANQLGAAAGLLTHRPAVLTTYQLEQFQPLWLWNASEVAAFSAASAIVTDSLPVAELVRRKLLRPRTIEVIPNGIDPPESSRTPGEMRAKLGLPTDPAVRIIGQISSLSPRKGHDVLLDAISRVVRKEPNVHFLFCGYARTPTDDERLRARAADLNIADRVTITGYAGRIGDAYKAVDIQVHAATAESLPNAIIEGMSLGKPLVVTSIAGIPSMIAEGVTGLVVPPHDAQALADALVRLLRDTQLAERLGNAAREKYYSGYTNKHMTARLEDLFFRVSAGATR